MSDLNARARVAHDALLHCYNDRGCVTCPKYDECEGDVSQLLISTAEILAEMIHERKVAYAVDAEPVRHGLWIEVKGAMRCSECMNSPLYDYHGRIALSAVCPRCGAKMYGGASSENQS